MLKRALAGRSARITFTHDFHELLRGDLGPGRTVVLRYDPLRIVPADDDYTFGDPARPVVTHAQFGDARPAICQTLISPAGMLRDPDIDPTGNGNMLRGELTLPADARELVLWFTYVSAAGETCYDSDHGHNFYFGFPGIQVTVLRAEIDGAGTNAARRGHLTVGTIPEVERVVVRLKAANRADVPKREVDLARTRDTAGDWIVWEMPNFSAPENTIVQFKLYYWIAGKRYKDDNDGFYYTVTTSNPQSLPAPPQELARAAAAWK